MKKIRHMSNKLDIIVLYLGNYSKILSGRDIARKSSLSPQTALNNLSQMVEKGILSFTVRGRNKEYELQLKNIQTRTMLEMAESYKALSRLENEELDILFNELFSYCESIILFGSFAEWKETKDSDIDLVIVGKADKKRIKQIKNKYAREINIEFINLTYLKKAINEKKALAVEILKKHILFGNIKSIVDIFLEYYSK